MSQCGCKRPREKRLPAGRHTSDNHGEEVAMLVGDIYKNEALSGDVFFIHGGLRLGSKG